MGSRIWEEEMKALWRTALLVIVVTASTAILATQALASPLNGPGYGGKASFDPQEIQALMAAMENAQVEDEAVAEDETFEVPPCEPADCEQMLDPEEGEEDIPGDQDVPDDQDQPGIDEENPGNDQEDDSEETPGIDEPGTPDTPELTEQPGTQAPPVTGSKLPNTGSTLALYAAIGLGIIVLAYAGRRMMTRRIK